MLSQYTEAIIWADAALQVDPKHCYSLYCKAESLIYLIENFQLQRCMANLMKQSFGQIQRCKQIQMIVIHYGAKWIIALLILNFFVEGSDKILLVIFGMRVIYKPSTCRVFQTCQRFIICNLIRNNLKMLLHLFQKLVASVYIFQTNLNGIVQFSVFQLIIFEVENQISNIFQKEENQFKISRSDANQLIPSLESAYYGLLIQGKYLPKLTSSIITSEYLLGVFFEKIYVPDLSEVQIGGLLKAVKKYELIEEVQKIQIQQKTWGIDQKHQPDKGLIINVLKTLKPNHYFFQNIKQILSMTRRPSLDQIRKIKELDLSMGRKTNVKRFFSYFERQKTGSRQTKENFEEKNFRKQNGQKVKSY